MFLSSRSNATRAMSSVASVGAHTLLHRYRFAQPHTQAYSRCLPLLSGLGRANHGHILHEAAKLAEQNQLKPLLAEQEFGQDIAAAYDAVAKGSRGKVVS